MHARGLRFSAASTNLFIDVLRGICFSVPPANTIGCWKQLLPDVAASTQLKTDPTCHRRHWHWQTCHVSVVAIRSGSHLAAMRLLYFAMPLHRPLAGLARRPSLRAEATPASSRLRHLKRNTRPSITFQQQPWRQLPQVLCAWLQLAVLSLLRPVPTAQRRAATP